MNPGRSTARATARSAHRVTRSSPHRPATFLGALQRLVFGAGVVMIGLFMSLQFTPQAQPYEAAQGAAAAKPAPVWDVDLDGDGVVDLANPTKAHIRGVDAYGSGKFGAPRDKGKRKHEGADFIVAAGASVRAPLSGVVSDIGYAYADDATLRYVEIKNLDRGLRARVFYVDPAVKVGETVAAGDAIGKAESLATRYPGGITSHVHLEMHDAAGALLDPAAVLPLGAAPLAQFVDARPSPARL